ncbi:hypothetical protein [Agromyces larvae]|uniref:Response regulator transcription factor n=1 Tax=Agromyces larvae TaxID=2929802 RepID=A0ABY4BX95_9MICO|nr:hypothetical protein [Agromyces larvae]UOE43851.1 hypothetical protein MTO99_17045 [Agromyces larvae]
MSTRTEIVVTAQASELADAHRLTTAVAPDLLLIDLDMASHQVVDLGEICRSMPVDAGVLGFNCARGSIAGRTVRALDRAAVVYREQGAEVIHRALLDLTEPTASRTNPSSRRARVASPGVVGFPAGLAAS